MYQYYMYGVLPNPHFEEIAYEINKNGMLVTIRKGDIKVSFPVTVSLPDTKKISVPSGGFPVIISFLNIKQAEYANLRGYAVITMVYLLDFCDRHFYGRIVDSDLSELHKSLYLEPANYDKFFDRFII